MSDVKVVNAGENTQEKVALDLLQMIMSAEKKTVLPHMAGRGGEELVSRAYILDTYAECLMAVRRPGGRPNE